MAGVAPPLTLDVPEGGEGMATIECAGTVGDRVTLQVTVSRDWIDLMIGTTVGGSEITQAEFNVIARRLSPGVHFLTFDVLAAAFFITGRRDARGLTAITDMQFVGVVDDLVIPTPYQEDDLRSLRFAQSRDFRWIWFISQMPRVLIRYANDSWGLAVYRSDDGPFVNASDGTVTLEPSARSGADEQLIASRDVFKSGHVGALFQASHIGQLVEREISGEDLWSDPIRVTGSGKTSGGESSGFGSLPGFGGALTGLFGSGASYRRFQIRISGTFVGTVTLQRSIGTDYNWEFVDSWTGPHVGPFDDELDNAVIYYRIGIDAGDYSSGTAEVQLIHASGATSGVARVIEVVDAKTARVDIVRPFAKTLPTRVWQEGAWSGERGWPAAGDLFDGRLWLGSILGIFASRPDNFAAMSVGDGLDGDAISRQIAVGDASPVRWLKGAFRLQVGVDAGAANIDAVRVGEAASMQIRSSALDEPLTPTNMAIRELSAKICFVDASECRILRLTFDLDTNTFRPDDLNRLHATIGFDGRGFVDLTFQARPQPRLFAPRADGQLAVLTLAEAEEVVGWSRLVYGAGLAAQTVIDELEDPDEDEFVSIVESVSATPGVDGTTDSDQDFVHMIVHRQVAGRRVRWHERVARERWRDAAEACFLEAATWFEGEPSRYLYGLDRFFGEQVMVWGDGAQLGPFDVVALEELDDSFVDGEIGIDLGAGNEVERAWIGLPMRTRYMSGKLPYGAQAGTAVGEPKKIDHITLLFKDTALGGVRLGIVDARDPDPFAEANLMKIPDVAEGFVTDDAVDLFSGEIVISNALHSFSYTDPRVVIQIDGCGPAALLGYVVNMTTQETG